MALTMLRSFNTDDILGWSPVRFAEETEHWESVEMILIEGASVSDLAVTKRKLQESDRAATIFGELCRRRLVRLLSFALQQSPHLVQAELPLNRSPLHEAACSGCPATVRCLISAGAAVNVADDHGMTPLHEAAAHSNDYAVRILLDAGATFDVADSGGRAALHYASRSGSVSCIQLLLAKGATVDRVSADGCTALHEAATSPSAHAVRLLLDAGADKHAKSAAGWTALHWAASRGRLYAVMILLEAGVPVDVKTVDEETPLHLAATLASTDIWEALVGAGADEGAMDKNGRTPKERAAEKSAPADAECDNLRTDTGDVSVDQPHVSPGVSNDSTLTSNNSGHRSAEISTVQLSNAPLNSTIGTGVEECVSSVPGRAANNEGSSLSEASNNSINVSEEPTAENLTLRLSSVTLNPTTHQTITGFQEDERASVEHMSVASGQRKDSVCSSLCEEYSELGDATESDGETDSEETEGTDESYSDDETASDEETGSCDETGSDTDEDDGCSYTSSVNEEIDKFSERGSHTESSSPILTTNTALFYEGPPLFHTLGTVGTSSKYNQRGTKYQGKFRGRGRGAPRGSRGNAAVYTTRSVPRKENATELSQSRGSEQRGSVNEKGIRNINGSVPQQARGPGNINCGQPNTVLHSGGTDQHTKGPNMKNDHRKKETHKTESKKSKKTKHSKSLLEEQGDTTTKHKKRKPPHGVGHYGNKHGVGHHSKRHGEGHYGNQHGLVHYGNQHGLGHYGNQHGLYHYAYQHALDHYGNQHSEGYHGNQHNEGRHGRPNQQGEGGNQHRKGHHINRYAETHPGESHHHNRHGEGHHGNRHGEAYYGNQHGASHHSNQYGEARHGNIYYDNGQGESRARKRHGEGRGGNWRGGGRGGNSHGKS